MPTSTLPSFLLGLATVAAATPSRADDLEIGGLLGGHRFAGDTELGVSDAAREPGPASTYLLGARVAVPFRDRYAIEAEAVVMPTRDDVLHRAATVIGWRAHARVDLATGAIRPFVVAGYGALTVRGGAPQLDDDTDQAYHWGGGVRVAVSPAIELRLDLRHLIVPDRTPGGATSDLEITTGLTWRIGRAAPPPRPHLALAPARVVAAPPAPPAPPPPAPPDRNGGGHTDEILGELTGIEFERSSATIDPASQPILDRAYVLLAAHATLRVEIAGHTSADGDPAYNRALSLRRADAVRAYLIARGIDGRRITTVGYGPDRPVDDNGAAWGRTRNRRIELRELPASEPPR
jgi:outer membrane protein OmpA-like peptidoglycan-associated protein